MCACTREIKIERGRREGEGEEGEGEGAAKSSIAAFAIGERLREDAR